MLVGQQLGPFAIDKELGAGAMGAVFRARYVKTGQVVAVKVMAPGLGDSNPNAVARFEREADILKRLNHPNIVRLFGHGKFQGTRFYAMEYVIGQSLDHVMARRGRMTWEEVVELGQQLCSALQHAHEAGVVHRDLKPSNLMVLADGTLKLTDFGIAKDLDSTALTSANCTVGTASYMSPEQCKGEREITNKSDLYSLGVVFYELITGHKPFQAESALDMFMLHVKGTFERPSRIVLDVPVWLDNLICQMLEKKPEQRPLNAAMVLTTLNSIQEKVEAQQSAGVEAVRARMVDRTPGARKANDEDKEAARTLRGGKSKSKKKKKIPFYRRLWFQAAGILAVLGFMVLVLYLVMQPPDPHSLYARAEKLMNSDKVEDHAKAYAEDGPIKTYLAHYASRAGDETAKVQGWKKQCDVEECEDRLQTLLRLHRKGLNSAPASDAEGQAKKATLAEESGDVADAQRLWQEMTQKYDANSGQEFWGILAANHLAAVQSISDREKALTAKYKEFRATGREPALEGIEQEAYKALRYEQFGDMPTANSRFDDIKEKSAKEPGLHFWEVFAARKCKELKPRVPDKYDANYRKKLIETALQQCQQWLEQNNRPDARATAADIVALYGDDSDLKELVDKARAIKDAASKPSGPS
jgi:eukaryotic-like serine/threonine-protein kinase